MNVMVSMCPFRRLFLFGATAGVLFGQSWRLLPEDSTRVYRVPEVVVTGSRNPTVAEYAPVRVEVFSPSATVSLAQTSLAELLEESAGIVQQYRIRSGIQLMGLEPAYTLILLNGQPLTGRVAGVLDLRRLPLGNVERVEIVKGPMSSLYGSTALGGVINVLTPRPRHGWQAQLRTQHMSRSGSEVHARLGYGNHHIAAQAYGSFRYSEPFTIVADTTVFPYAGFTEVALQTTAYWNPARSWELQADGRLFQSRTHGAFAESYGGQLAVNHGVFRQREWSSSLTARWTYGRARLQVGLFGNRYEEFYNWDVPTGAAQGDDFVQRLGRLWAQYDLLWKLRYRFTFGGEFLYEDVIGARYPDHPLSRTAAAFLQWEGTPYHWLSYALSLRWDATSAYGKQWSPKAAFLVRPWGERGVQFRSSIGTGFRAPDFRQLFISFTNRLQGAGYALMGARRMGTELLPERSVACDASAVFPLRNCFPALAWEDDCVLELRVFANWVHNLIEPYYVGRFEGLDVYSYRNIARIATRGVEATLRGGLVISPLWKLQLRTAYQFLDAVDLDVLDAIAAGLAGTQDPTTGRFTPLRRSDYGGLWGRSRHTLSGTLQVTYVPMQTALFVRFAHRSRFGDEALDRNGIAVLNPPRRVLDRADEYVPGFWNLSCWLTHSWNIASATLTLAAGGRNLLNVLNPRFIPELVGRQWFISADLQWNSTAE